MRRKLLIVEDDDATYESVRFALRSAFANRDVCPEVERAVTLQDAKRKLTSFNPRLVSIDMEFPLERIGGRQEERAGAALLSHIRSRHRSMKCVIYSGTEKETIEERLCEAGVNDFPPIVAKNAFAGGGSVLLARTLTDMILGI